MVFTTKVRFNSQSKGVYREGKLGFIKHCNDSLRHFTGLLNKHDLIQHY